MRAFFKYAVILALGLAVGFYIRAPLSLEEIARLNWLHEINIIIDKAVARAKPEAAVIPVDPAGAALIDDELDYRIAQRIDSLDGWRAFLAVHGNGVYAQSARAEVGRLLAAKAPAEVPNGASPDAKATIDGAGSAPPSPGTEVATLTPDEICKRDGDRLERLRSSPTRDETARFANELGCETLRPQLLAFMEVLGYASPAPAAAEVSNGTSPDAKATSDGVGSAPPSPGMEVAAHARGNLNVTGTVWNGAQQPHERRGCALRERIGLRDVATPALGSDGELGLRVSAGRCAAKYFHKRHSSGPKAASDCASERDALDRLPTRRSAEKACERLRFQVRVFLGKLVPAADSSGAFGERPKHSSASRRTLTYPRPNDFRGR